MITREIRRRLRDQYRYPGFYPGRYVEVAKWDPGARILSLTRRSKKLDAAPVEELSKVGTTVRSIEQETCRAEKSAYSWNLIFVARNVVIATW